MQIAVTGATGFLGHYLVRQLARSGHRLRCWYRDGSDRGGFNDVASSIDWVAGELSEPRSMEPLIEGCDAVVHAALYYTGHALLRGEGEIVHFVETNVLGTIRLIEAARKAHVGRFVFISSCAVHDKILSDRPLDETHPTWASTHYGAHKAAIEQFVHSYGFGQNYGICALRPTGIYGVARPAEDSKWFSLVEKVVRGEPVECRGGGKEVHAADVARAAEILLDRGAPGEPYSCYDRYVSEFEVAMLAKRLSGSSSEITGAASMPKNQIVTDKLQALGMHFGGAALLEQTIAELVADVQAKSAAPAPAT